MTEQKQTKTEKIEKTEKKKLANCRSRLFDGRLVMENFRRLRLPGLIGLALLVAGVVCCMVMRQADWGDVTGAAADMFYAYNASGPSIWVSLSYALTMQYMAMLLVPVMILVVFGHGNRRAESDLYDTLPVKKSVMFRSGIAAVLLWVVILIAVTTAATAIIAVVQLKNGYYSNADEMLIVCMGNVLFAALKAFAVSLLVIGAFALAMSATGTYVTNIATGLVILLGPTIFIRSMIANLLAMPFIDTTHGLMKHFSTIYNLFARVMVGEGGGIVNPSSTMMIESDYAYPFIDVTPFTAVTQSAEAEFTSIASYIAEGLGPIVQCCIYCMVLGIVYTLIAGVLYKRRRSEVAERPALNAAWRAILHIAPTLLLFVIGTNQLVDQLVRSSRDRLSWWFLTWYAAGLVFYMLYERIVTRSMRKMLRSLILFPVVPVIAAVIGLASYGIMEYTAGRQPDAEEVISMRIEGLYGNYEPFSKQLGQITFTSDSIKREMAEALKSNVSDWRRAVRRGDTRYDDGVTPFVSGYGSHYGYSYSYEDLYWSSQDVRWPTLYEDDSSAYSYIVRVQFETENGTFWRRVAFSNSRTSRIALYLDKEEEVLGLKTELCDMDDEVRKELLRMYEVTEDPDVDPEELPNEELDGEISIRDEYDFTPYMPFSCAELGWNLSQTQLLSLYNTYREEVQTLDRQYRIFLGMNGSQNDVLEYLCDDSHSMAFPITLETPKTAALLCNLETERSAYKYDLDAFFRLAKQCDREIDILTVNEDGTPKSGSNVGTTEEYTPYEAEADILSMKINYIYYDHSEQTLSSNTINWGTDGKTYSSMGLSAEQMDEVSAILSAHDGEEIDLQQDAILIVLLGDDIGRAVGRWYNLTEEDAVRIKELMTMREYHCANYYRN